MGDSRHWAPLVSSLLFAGALLALGSRALGTDRTVEYVIASFVTFAFCLVSAIHLLGPKSAAAFALIGIVFGWLAEQIGTTTGVIFGPYTYVPGILGPSLGEVPVVVPLMWFALVYIAYIMANLLVWQSPVDQRRGLLEVVGLSLLAALIVSAYNLGTDPYNQHVVGAYIAGVEGRYFGVPFMAYVGWTAVAFLICLTFRLVVHKVPIQPVTRVTKRFVALPIMLYIGFMAFYVAEGFPEAVKVIVVFAMGIPSLAAIVGFERWSMHDTASSIQENAA